MTCQSATAVGHVRGIKLNACADSRSRDPSLHAPTTTSTATMKGQPHTPANHSSQQAGAMLAPSPSPPQNTPPHQTWGDPSISH
jgi:hypothetical protein